MSAENLPVEMREAAHTLVSASYRFTGCSTEMQEEMELHKWSARELVHWAQVWQDVDRRQAAEEAQKKAAEAALVEDLAVELHMVSSSGDFGTVLWKQRSFEYREKFREQARHLVKVGWRKVEPQ